MPNKRRTKSQRDQDHPAISFADPQLPPGIVIESYELTDLLEYDTSSETGEVVHTVVKWTTLRDNAIDRWLDAERCLRTACTILMSPNEAIRARVWTLMLRQSGDSLIELLNDLLVVDGHEAPEDFRSSLKALAKVRNLLAHQASRPRENLNSDGLVVLRSTGFKGGAYVEIAYADIEKAISDATQVMEWLTETIPEVDGVEVPFEEEVFDLLRERDRSIRPEMNQTEVRS